MDSPANVATRAKLKLDSPTDLSSCELGETYQISKDQQSNVKLKLTAGNADNSAQNSSVLGGENILGHFHKIDNGDRNYSKCATELHSELSKCFLPKPKFASLHHDEGKVLISPNGQFDYPDESSFNLPNIKRLSPEDIVKAVNRNNIPTEMKVSTGEAGGNLSSLQACPPHRSHIGDYTNYKPLGSRQSQVAGGLDVGSQQTLRNVSFPPVTWLQYDVDAWHSDALVPEMTAGKKRSNRVIWKPPKATLVFNEPSSARKAAYPSVWSVDDSFKHLEIDDSRFPTEHKLATSESLRDAMRSMKAAEAEARQNRQRKSISFFSKTKETFSKRHNCLPRTSRLDLQLKYKHVMAHVKREEYLQWEHQAMSRSGYPDPETYPQPFERHCGRFMPFQRQRAFDSKLSKPRPTKSRRRSIGTEFIYDRASAEPISHRIEAANRIRDGNSPASHGPESEGQGERNPSPTSCTIEPMGHGEGVVKFPDQAPPSNAGSIDGQKQGDGPSTAASEHKLSESTDTVSMMRRKLQHSGDNSVQSALIETEPKKHPEECSCRSCMKTAEWINTLATPRFKSLDLSPDAIGDSRKPKVTFVGFPSSPERRDSTCSDGQDAFSGALRMSQYSSLGEDT